MLMLANRVGKLLLLGSALLLWGTPAAAKQVTTGTDQYGRAYRDVKWVAKGTSFVHRFFKDGSAPIRYARGRKGTIHFKTTNRTGVTTRGKIWGLQNGTLVRHRARTDSTGRSMGSERMVVGKRRFYESGPLISPSMKTTVRMWKVGPRGNALGISSTTAPNGRTYHQRIGRSSLPRIEAPTFMQLKPRSKP
jgi:hypothetical protein